MSNIQYAVHGAASQFTFGNNVWHEPTYNSRLQMGGFSDLLNNAGTPLLSATLNWNPSGSAGDNGNLWSSTFSNGGPGYSTPLSFTQTYSYNGVNRLTSATDTGGWLRSLTYDAYGNMTPAGPGAPTISFNTNNQITTLKYDQAGNQLAVNGNTLAYDLENRVISETDGVSKAVETYVYDGNGNRVQKYLTSAGTVTSRTIFVYDALGRMAAEYAISVDTPSCVTCYLSPDHLGTPRLTTDQNGSVVQRHDYMPFGEEVLANQYGRDSTWGSLNDSIKQKFTAKERDFESGLDYFGARYYGSALGRFISPDPKAPSAKTLMNP